MSSSRIAIIAADKQILELVEGWLHTDAATSDIETFSSTKEAISVLRSIPAYDLIITAESFAEVGELIWLKALRKLFPHTSLAFLGVNETPDEAIRSAVDEDPSATYLTKPYARQLLLGDLYDSPEMQAEIPGDIPMGEVPMDDLANALTDDALMDFTVDDVPAHTDQNTDPMDDPTDAVTDDALIDFSVDDVPAQANQNADPEAYSEEEFIKRLSATGTLLPDQHETMAVLLKALKENVSAHSVYLVDYLGQSLFHSGNAASEHLVEIASLLGGSFAALLEVGEIVDDEESPMNLIYRQGKKDDIYALSVARSHLLILLIARGSYTTRVGTVWYYVRDVAPALTDILNSLALASSSEPSPFDNDMSAALDEELESLLPSIPPEGWSIHSKDPGEDWPFGAEQQSEEALGFDQDQNGAPEKEELFDLQSANEMGLIPEDILEKLMPTNKVEYATGELKAE